MEKQKMTAKKKAKLSVIIGIIAGLIVGLIPNALAMDADVWQAELLVFFVIYPPIFILYSFGYVFGWTRTKRWTAAVLGVSADILFFSLLMEIIHKRGLAGGITISLFLISFVVGLAWIPGVFQGIIELYRERKLVTVQ